MKTIYVLFELITNEDDSVTKKHLGTFYSVQDCRAAIKDFLFINENSEILIEKKK